MRAVSSTRPPMEEPRLVTAREELTPQQLPRAGRPNHSMGLSFSNALGLAAGIDHTGTRLVSLAKTGAGHVEVGTVTEAAQLTLSGPPWPENICVGVNFASARTGLGRDVIEDYVRLLRFLWCRADYLVANVSSPYAGRHPDMPGIELLISRLAEVGGHLIEETGKRKPLLIKVPAGEPGTRLPHALIAARTLGLDGVVLVTPSVSRLMQVCNYLCGAAVISVQGIATAEQASERLAAGASLVQIYSAFVDEGPSIVPKLLGRQMLAENAP